MGNRSWFALHPTGYGAAPIMGQCASAQSVREGSPSARVAGTRGDPLPVLVF